MVGDEVALKPILSFLTCCMGLMRSLRFPTIRSQSELAHTSFIFGPLQGAILG